MHSTPGRNSATLHSGRHRELEPGMPEDEDAKRIAEENGLGKLNEKQLAQLVKSRAGTRGLTARIPKDLHWSEEPAVSLSLVPSKRRGA